MTGRFVPQEKIRMDLDRNIAALEAKEDKSLAEKADLKKLILVSEDFAPTDFSWKSLNICSNLSILMRL